MNNNLLKKVQSLMPAITMIMPTVVIAAQAIPYGMEIYDVSTKSFSVSVGEIFTSAIGIAFCGLVVGAGCMVISAWIDNKITTHDTEEQQNKK